MAKNTVFLVGAGGAGAALAHALVELGAHNLIISDSRIEAAEALADQISGLPGNSVASVASSIEDAIRSSDGIVNATPMGMAKLPGTPVDPDLFDPHQWVAEIVYFPRETEFLRAAKAKGCQTLDGSGMAVFQAVRAFQLFTGLEANPARMRATFEKFETN